MYNVKDKDGGNIWNDIYPSGGNYWHDYTGKDNNSDGMGDEPYYIMGDFIISGLDNYPWMNQNGWNNAPEKPTITGKTSGKPNTEYKYTFKAIDTNKDKIYFEIDWGDQGQFEWSEITSYEAKVKHTYSSKGTYTIQARAVDNYGAEGDWATLTVTMPRNKAINTPVLDFLTNHPNLFPILQKILNWLGY